MLLCLRRKITVKLSKFRLKLLQGVWARSTVLFFLQFTEVLYELKSLFWYYFGDRQRLGSDAERDRKESKSERARGNLLRLACADFKQTLISVSRWRLACKRKWKPCVSHFKRHEFESFFTECTRSLLRNSLIASVWPLIGDDRDKEREREKERGKEKKDKDRERDRGDKKVPVSFLFASEFEMWASINSYFCL